ncbi:hypothetical protein LJR290_005916 [Variovorax sp. LjRoot290]|uniref:hypothetical protein n=1 Tax=Variovorax sp. LjRoot290 TaxID=3342316 RepID=UPI003ED0B069
MLKRLSWQEDLVLSVKLADDLFTLAQMRVGSCMQFYDIRSADGQWLGVDLSRVPSLFCAKVAENRLKPLFVEKVDASRVQPDRRPMPTQMIDYQLSGDGDPRADLIELDAKHRYSSVGARIIKSGLTIEQDLNVIRTHELVGMLGDPEKLRKRLLRYFETGVNWDDAKAFIFKGISPPPPAPRRT